MNSTTDSVLEHNIKLNLDIPLSPIRNTGIICTIGPVTRSVENLVELIEAGMSIARMNFSHGTHEYHSETMANVRKAAGVYSQKIGRPVSIPIAMDTKGPEIRSGLLEGGPSAEIELVSGETIKLTTDVVYAEKSSKDILYVDYVNITKVLKAGSAVFVDDGLISLTAKEVGSDFVNCLIENGGMLGSKKGINLPGTPVDLPAVSEKDKNDLQLGVKEEVDFVFASFIRDAKGVLAIRKVLGDKGRNIKIISKIENQQGIRNMDEIIEASDGVMVARGDMGIEISPEQVLLVQKTMIARCNVAGKPVICATQMLESMVKKPRPTRAEVSDVANAVLDGADCVMLSGETAKGSFPVNCVRVMSDICRQSEAIILHRSHFNQLTRLTPARDHAASITMAAVSASLTIRAAAIVCLTTTGISAHQLSMFRPQCPIIAVTRQPQTARQCRLYRGLLPLIYSSQRQEDWLDDVEQRIQYAIAYGKSEGFVRQSDPVVVITGWKTGAGSTNTLRVITA